MVRTLPDPVSWIQKYKNERRSGLGFNHKKKNKMKKNVDLPSSRICSYCGNSGHLVSDSSSREEHIEMNTQLVRQVWKVKRNTSPAEEPKSNCGTSIAVVLNT